MALHTAMVLVCTFLLGSEVVSRGFLLSCSGFMSSCAVGLLALCSTVGLLALLSLGFFLAARLTL